MVRGYERYYQKASTRDPGLDGRGRCSTWTRGLAGGAAGPDGNTRRPRSRAGAPLKPPGSAKLGNTTCATAAGAYSTATARCSSRRSPLFWNDTASTPGVQARGTTCALAKGKECKAGRCPKMKVAGAPVDSMLVALPFARRRRQRGRRQPSPSAMHFLTAVVSGVGACSSSASTATPSSRRGRGVDFYGAFASRVASTALIAASRIDGVESPRERIDGVESPRVARRRRVAQPEFGAGGHRWYAAVGAYFYCQLAVNFVVFVTFVDTRCKHHNILVVNRVDYTGLDFCALAGVEADASCGYGTATSPACAVGAQSLRPLRWARKGAAFQAPTAWLGDSGWRQVFPWWLSVFFIKERSAIMREKPGDNCVWSDDRTEEEQNCNAGGRRVPGHDGSGLRRGRRRPEAALHRRRDSAPPRRPSNSVGLTTTWLSDRALAAQVGRRAPVGASTGGVHERAAPGHPLPPGGDAAAGRAGVAADGDPRFIVEAGLGIMFYFMYDMAVMNYVGTTWTTRISSSATRRRTPGPVSSCTAR